MTLFLSKITTAFTLDKKDFHLVEGESIELDEKNSYISTLKEMGYLIEIESTPTKKTGKK